MIDVVAMLYSAGAPVSKAAGPVASNRRWATAIRSNCLRSYT